MLGGSGAAASDTDPVPAASCRFLPVPAAEIVPLARGGFPGPEVATLAPFGHSGSWRATVTQIRGLEVATLAPFGHSDSWRATLTQIRALEVATLAPFGRSTSWRATVTQIRGLEVATLAPFGRSQSWRATVTRIRGLKVATLAPFGHSGANPTLSIHTNSRSSASAALTGMI